MPLSGQNTITTAGTAERLDADERCDCTVYIKALTTNTGLAYIGHDGADDVSSSNGYPLAAGDQLIFENVQNLSNIWVDVAVSGEGVAWLKGKA